VKIVAFTAGRRGGNCEILVKTALLAASNMGVECELIRLNECNLQPCKACPHGPCFKNGPSACIHRDDGGFLADKFLESDGYILAAPVWSLSPCGIVTVFRDRVFGPKMDMAGWELNGLPAWANGRKVSRAGGLISVGGALSEHWTSLGLATLYTTTFSAHTRVVDQINAFGVASLGEALLREDYLQRAAQLGRNVAEAVLNPNSEQTESQIKDFGPTKDKDVGQAKDKDVDPVKGEDFDPVKEACPGCHTSLVIAKPGRDYVECAICGRRGYVTLKDSKLSYTWPEDSADRIQLSGLLEHMREIKDHSKGFKPHAEEIKEKLQYYRELEDFTVMPPKGNKSNS